MDAQLQAAVLLLDNMLAQQTVATEEDAYVQILESDFAASQARGARLFRSRVAGAVSSGAAVLNPLLTAYAHHVVGVPERSPQAALDRIYQYFVDNSKSIKSRGVTYGSIASFGSNKGALVRLTVDENGYDLEHEFVEAKVVTCIKDENTGAERYREVFELRGGNKGVDSLDATKSGALRRDFTAKDSSTSLLRNSSFSQYSIAASFSAGRAVLAAADTITGWTMNAETNFALDQNTALVARDIVGDTTPTSLVFESGSTGTITQAFSVNRLKLAANLPYLAELWVYPHASLTTGTMTVTWGSQSEAFTLSTLTAGAWNQVFLTRDKLLWPANFNVAGATFAISIASHDQEVLVDEVRFGSMEPFDGTWWHAGGSSAAKFLLDDTTTITDSFTASDSKIQHWLWRVYARHLPHYDDATGITAAGGRTLTFNDNGGSPDTITLSTGDCTSDGYVVGQTLTVASSSSNDGTYVLTAVAATTLTVATGSLTAEGPVSATTTLAAGASIADPT
jgi:hypothetical protein